ncbi:MAG: fructose 1,6-bisphosphatase [bacterium]
MKTTLTLAKADIGSIGGHIKPSRKIIEAVTRSIKRKSAGLISDFHVSHTGDDIAMLLVHRKGKDARRVHKFIWDTFVSASREADKQGFSGCAMLPYSELEYGGIVRKMEALDARFRIRKKKHAKPGK